MDRLVALRAPASPSYPSIGGRTHRCPCGYSGDPVKEGTCSPTVVACYQKRISGPLLDRIDIHVEVPRIEHEEVADDRLGETLATIRARVEMA